MKRGTLVAVLAIAACGKAGPLDEARPGDSLFDRLDSATLVSYPASNLPPDLARRAQAAPRLRTLPFSGARWAMERTIPESFRPLLPSDANYFLYRARPDLALMPGADPPRILKHGEDYPAWDSLTDPFPGEFVWWDGPSASLLAVGTGAPGGVVLEALVDSAVEFGSLDVQSDGQLPLPAELERRVTFADVTCRSLLLPSGSTLSFPLASLEADTLSVEVGIIDRAWRVLPGSLTRTKGRSDGATFAVDVVQSDGTATRVWSRAVPASGVGAHLGTDSIALSRWTGQAVTIRLVTEPGPSGDPFFDWAVWSSLRLSGTPRRVPSRPHIVLISIDTWRRDRLHLRDTGPPHTPQLASWASQHAVVFDDALATAPWTLPSTASLLTGLAVHQHGIIGFPQTLPEELPTAAGLLAAAGYETVGIADGGYLSATFGFDSGFEHYDARRQDDAGWRSLGDWLARRRSERPLFLFLHTYLVHAPYEVDDRYEDPAHPYAGPLSGKPVTSQAVIVPFRDGTLHFDAPDRAYIKRLYDAGVARMDDLLGEVLADIEAHLAHQNVLVIVTSDHGEEFFEHDLLGHGQSLYQELLAVPLLVRFPDGSRTGHSGKPVSLLDVLPTILDAADIEPPRDLPGHSLIGPLPDRRIRIAQYKDKAHAVQFGGTKLILGDVDASPWTRDTAQLYRLDTDPAERHNLAADEPDRLSALAGFLERYLEQWSAPDGEAGATIVLDEQLQSELRALGYLGDG